MKARFVKNPIDMEDVIRRESLSKLESYKIIEEKELTTSQYDYFIQGLSLGRGWLNGKGEHSGGIRHVIRVHAHNRHALLIDPQNSNYPVAVALEGRI